MKALLAKPRFAVLVTASLGIIAACGCSKPPPAAVPSGVPSLRQTARGQVTVKGQVIGPVGQPVAGARVVVSQGRGSFDYTEVETDEEGRFEITLEAPPYWDTVAWCCVCADGLAVGGSRLTAGDNLIVLRRPGEAAGTVVDVRGRPVQGAAVRLARVNPGDMADSFSIPPGLADAFTAETDEGGRWTIRSVPPFGSGWFELDDPRFAREAKQAGFTVDQGTSATLVARPGASLSGRVVYEDGTLAVGIVVMAQARDLESTASAWAEGVTAANGSYQLTGLSDGTFNILVDEPSGEWVVAALEGVTASAPTDVELPDLILTRGAIIEGTVTDMTTGEPLPGVCVGSYGPHRPMSSSAIISDYTDSHGRYQLRVAPGHSTIYVAGAPPGYQEGKAATVDLEQGESAVADFAVGPPGAPPRRNKGWWPF
jgi:protocatechuate 3,4-dioxygenase beta subunit